MIGVDSPSGRGGNAIDPVNRSCKGLDGAQAQDEDRRFGSKKHDVALSFTLLAVMALPKQDSPLSALRM